MEKPPRRPYRVMVADVPYNETPHRAGISAAEPFNTDDMKSMLNTFIESTDSEA